MKLFRRHLAIGCCWATLFACAAGARDSASDEAIEETTDMSRPIEVVLADRTDAWMALDGVTGTGIGLCDGEACLVVFALRDTEALRRALPQRTEGYLVDLRVTGRFRARDSL